MKQVYYCESVRYHHIRVSSVSVERHNCRVEMIPASYNPFHYFGWYRKKTYRTIITGPVYLLLCQLYTSRIHLNLLKYQEDEESAEIEL